MIERSDSREVISSANPKEHLGLQVRIAMGNVEALNPENITLNTGIESLRSKIDYSAINAASTAERAEYWEGKSDKQKAWSEGMINVFASKKEFFENEGKSWAELYSSFGINPLDFKQEDADKIYAKYFSGERNGSDVESYMRDVSNFYADTANLDAIEWFANIFGNDKSSEIIRNVSSLLGKRSSGKLDELHTQVTRINHDGNSRMNNLDSNPREMELLTFLWEHKVKEVAAVEDVVDTRVTFENEELKNKYLGIVKIINSGVIGEEKIFEEIKKDIKDLKKGLSPDQQKALVRELATVIDSQRERHDFNRSSTVVRDKIYDYETELRISQADIESRSLHAPTGERRRMGKPFKKDGKEDVKGVPLKRSGVPSEPAPFVDVFKADEVKNPKDLRKPIVLGGKRPMLEEVTQVLDRETGKLAIIASPNHLVEYAKSISGLPNKGKIEALAARFIGENLELSGRVTGKKGPITGVIDFSLEFMESPGGIRLSKEPSIRYNAAASFARDQIEPKIRTLDQEIINGLTKAVARTGAKAESVHIKDGNIVVNFSK